jgi:hypothetical protein
VIINTFQSSHYFVLDLVPSESDSLVDDTNEDFWYTALYHPFNANMNQILSYDGYLILDYFSSFISNQCVLSNSKHNIPNPVESKSIEVFELIPTDISRLLPN